MHLIIVDTTHIHLELIITPQNAAEVYLGMPNILQLRFEGKLLKKCFLRKKVPVSGFFIASIYTF